MPIGAEIEDLRPRLPDKVTPVGVEEGPGARRGLAFTAAPPLPHRANH